MEAIKVNLVLDAKGLACPMPIVKTKKAMNDLLAGQVIEIQATDKGSKSDLKAWAESTGHQYLGTIEEANVLKHFVRKSSTEETIERTHPHTVSNEQLEASMSTNQNMILLDVREEAEYAFHHIPNSKSVPLGELESRLAELDKEVEIYVVCRTGNRSDLAAQLLNKNGYTKVFNVIPGMSQWNGAEASLIR